jgi:hypothetical protein
VIEPGGGFAVEKRNDGLATASLVTGITSLVCCGLVTGIPAIILGLVARNRIARSPATLGGGGMATAGVVLGIIGSLVSTSIAVLAGVLVYNATAAHPPTAAAIPCDLLEHTAYHYHVGLQIIDQGNQVAIPPDVGRTGLCYYWLHMHASSQGLIHVESPDLRTYTLGDFFDVWAKTSSQPVRFDTRHVGTITLSAGERVVAFVDGKRYDGNPRAIPLVAHQVIQLEIIPPTLDPPPAFAFPAGF